MIARTLLLSLILASAMNGASAQDQAKAPPPPAVPPPLPDIGSDTDLAPQVTIIRRNEQVVEEVRVGGQLRYIRVTPNHGRPYYLIPDVNGATYIRRDSLDSSLKVPLWVLFSF